MGRGKRTRKSDSGTNWTLVAAVGVIALLAGAFVLPNMDWSSLWNNPFVHPPNDVAQGLKLTGTVTFANHTAVDSESVLFVYPNNHTTAYTGSISGGTFTTNRGPESGGLFAEYINIDGCMLYVQEVNVPRAEDYEHETYFVGDAIIYSVCDTWNVLVTAGSVANSYTSGASAATSNYTLTHGTETEFDFKITNAEDYSKLFRQYTDPFDGIALEPVLWVEVGTATGVYTTSSGVETWSAGSKSYFLLPLNQITAPGTSDVSEHWTLSLVVSSAGNYTLSAWIVDGSYLSYLAQAKARVSDPATGESVSAYQILDCYLIVS